MTLHVEIDRSSPNFDKSSCGQTSIPFLGDVISKEGSRASYCHSRGTCSRRRVRFMFLSGFNLLVQLILVKLCNIGGATTTAAQTKHSGSGTMSQTKGTYMCINFDTYMCHILTLHSSLQVHQIKA